MASDDQLFGSLEHRAVLDGAVLGYCRFSDLWHACESTLSCAFFAYRWADAVAGVKRPSTIS